MAIVKPSLRLSVRLTRKMWQNEKYFCSPSHTIWKVDSCDTKWLVGDVPFYTRNFGQIDPSLKNSNFQSIFACSASAVSPSEKVQIVLLLLTGSPLRAFQWAYDEQSMLPVSLFASKPQSGSQKRKVTVFRIKLHFCLRKSVINFLCVKTFSDKVVRHSPAYNGAQIVGGGRPLKRKFCL